MAEGVTLNYEQCVKHVAASMVEDITHNNRRAVALSSSAFALGLAFSKNMMDVREDLMREMARWAAESQS